MMFPRRLLFASLAFAAILLAVAAGLFLSAPLWIDANSVKQKIAELVHRATGDVVHLDRLQLDVFPAITVTISQPRYVAADVADVSARQAIVELDFWPLLAGNVHPGTVRLSGVNAKVRIPPPAANSQPLSRAQAEQGLRDGLARLRELAPGMDVVVEDASVTIQLPDRPVLALNKLQARLRVAADGATLAAECSSPLWTRALVNVSLAQKDLSGRGHAELVGLDLAGLTSFLGVATDIAVSEASLIGTLDWRMQGLSSIQGNSLVSTPGFVVRTAQGNQPFSGLTAAASFDARGNSMALQVDRLYLQSPRLLMSARLERAEDASLAFSAEGSDVSIPDLLAVAANLAPQATWVAKPPARLRAGTVASFALHTSAEALEFLFDPSALWGEVTLRDISADLQKPAVRVDGVGGTLAFDKGRLDARGITAALGKSTLTNGTLAATYTDDPALLDAGGLVDLDLAEAVVLAKSFVSRDARVHLDALQDIDGSTLARFELRNRRGRLDASVELTEIALGVRHRDIPLPLRLRQGRLRYGHGQLALDGASGEFGRSDFAGLDASLQLAPPWPFEVHQRQANIDLEDVYTAFRTAAFAAPMRAEVGNVTGHATLSGLEARGTLEALDATQFQVSMSPQATKARVSRLDADVLMDGGRIGLTDRGLAIQDVGLDALDAKLRVSAEVPGYRAGAKSVDVTANGTVGGNALTRIEKASTLPASLWIRAPLQLAGVRVRWERSGDVSANGSMNVAGATDIGFEVRKDADALFIDRLAVKDAGSDANLKARLTDKAMNLEFRGTLAGSTLANVFVQPPVTLQRVEGDIGTTVHFGKPWISHSQGRLSGAGIGARLPSGETIGAERFALDADAARIRIEDSIVSVGENRAEVRGDVNRRDGKLALDLNVKSSRIVLPKPDAGHPAEKRATPFRLSDLPFTGRIVLDIGQLEAERVTLTPLEAEATIAAEGVDVRIVRASLCDITMSGTLKGPLEDLELAGSLTARQADLEKSISCLTGGRIGASGTLELDARFSSRGPYEALSDRIDGRFSATARDGHIEQFDTLNRIFAFLNVTEVVRGQKLGVAGHGLPYRSAKVDGTLKGKSVGVEEAVLDAPTVHIAATGRIDYGANDLSMDVLVAPLQTANVLMDKIPLVNRIFGGAVLALPVHVVGPPASPTIVPLGPHAVAKRMTSIIANTLRLPYDAIKMVAPQEPADPAQAGDKK